MRFFEITITKNWIEEMVSYQSGENHKQISEKLENKNKRATNNRFREIERTGEYYRITEVCKGGKSFIFEIL